MDTRAPAVVAVVVTTGPGPGLEATLASLVAQDYPEISVLVAANGETQGVGARVAAVAPQAFVAELTENRGFGAACNEAALMVQGSAFYLFCHDDVRLSSDAVSLMVEAAYRANAAIVTPKVVQYDDPLVLVHVGQTSDRFGVARERCEPGEIDHGQQDLERDVFVAPGGVTLVRADLFSTLRGFDPLISVLGEDLDLCWRAQVAGARIIVAPQAKVAHRESIARGERRVTALGTRRRSRQDLIRRHQLLVVATGWSSWRRHVTLAALGALDLGELVLSLVGRDVDRAGAIVEAWRFHLFHRRALRERRRQLARLRVLSDAELSRLQVPGASRLKEFVFTLLRHGLDRARGILPQEPPPEEETSTPEASGVGFAAAFSESEEFDEIIESRELALRRSPARTLVSFRAQALVVGLLSLAWLVGSRNLVAMHLPIVGRLVPLDSWWSTWRHFFASWSPAGVGTGTPAPPGYGVVAIAGTFVLGRMGVLPRLVLIFAVPLGAFGVARFLAHKVSNRARLLSAFAYAAIPVGINAVGGGRLDVLTVVAGLPFVARRLFEILDVPGFRVRPYDEPVPFGHRGWRTSEAGQRMVLIMVVAIVTAMAPATLVAVAVLILGVSVSRLFEPDEGHRAPHPARLMGALLANVAIFLLPLSVDVVLSGHLAPSVFGLARGPWSTPGLSDLARGADGFFGQSWWAWSLPLGAAVAFLTSRGTHRALASKLATSGVLALVLATLSGRHWMGSFTPSIDVLLALYGLCVAGLIGVGIATLEGDLLDLGFGWRQLAAVVVVPTVMVALAPFLSSLETGRFNLPTTSVASSLANVSPTTPGGYRILWLGDPSTLPTPGWSVAPGLALATSTNGLPGGATLFTPPISGTSSLLVSDVRQAMDGETVRLGSLLAQAGVSTIVVLQASAPELAGVQEVPIRKVPAALTSALARQGDLSLGLSTSSAEIYTNSLFRGVVSATTPPSTSAAPLFQADHFSGPVVAGSSVRVDLAPAGAFALDVNSSPTARTTFGSWAPYYQVPLTKGPLTGTVVLHQFPLNGLLALFTLGLWFVVWLGFGVVERLEWLFTGRRPQRRGDE